MSKEMLPFNLQFFAEEASENTKESEKEDSKETDSSETDSKESGSKETVKNEPNLQDLMVEVAKLKRAVDKSTSEAATWKRKYRETLSEKEQADQEKAEEQAKKEERFAELERKDKIHEFTEHYMDMKYPKELAKKAAAAQVDGDTETLFTIQQQVTDQLLKEKEAEWLASRPPVQTGNGSDSDEEDPFIKGFKSVKQ